MKSQVSLCSGMSHLGREEAERRFFSFTTWRFLKCHNQRFSHTLLFHSNSFYLALFFIFPILLFFPSFFLFPWVFCSLPFLVNYSLPSAILSPHHSDTWGYYLIYLRSLIWQADRPRVNRSHETVRQEKQAWILTSSAATSRSKEGNGYKTKSLKHLVLCVCVGVCAAEKTSCVQDCLGSIAFKSSHTAPRLNRNLT